MNEELLAESHDTLVTDPQTSPIPVDGIWMCEVRATRISLATIAFSDEAKGNYR